MFPLELFDIGVSAVPGGYPDVGSKAQPLPAGMGQFVRLEEKLQESRFDVHGWRAMFRWVNEGVAFPSGCYRQWIGDFYQRNKLVRGELVIKRAERVLSNIRCPLLNVVASTDIIAPRPTTNAILSHVAAPISKKSSSRADTSGIVVGKAQRWTCGRKYRLGWRRAIDGQGNRTAAACDGQWL